MGCYEEVRSIGSDTLALADLAEVHSALGDGYAAKEDWENSARYYDLAHSGFIACDDRRGIAYVALGAAQAWAKLGQVDREILAYQEALTALEGQDLIANCGIIHIGLGAAYSKKKAWPEALCAYKAAVECAVQSGDISGAASAHRHLGFAQLEAGCRPEAAEQFYTAASLERQAGNQEQADEMNELARSLGVR